MNTIREIQQINDEELKRGLAGTPASWHAKYAQSAWVYVGNLDHELTEGDVICVLSQYGEIEDFNLSREEDTGKSKGFAFAKYEDARSCILAVDNFCGVKLCGRSLRVDHVENYRLPKHLLEKEKHGVSGDNQLTQAGRAYQGQELANEFSLHQGHDLFAPQIDKSKTDSTGSTQNDKPESTEAKRERKEERRRQKQMKNDRKRERDRIRMDREERRRERRARDMDPEKKKKKDKGKKRQKE